MNTFIRWSKFNLVGAVGMAVQLAALAVFNRWTGGHYMVATAAAIELTLLHNFAWHLRFTWRDRRDNSALLGQIVRFHLSNGLVSMVGNLALMRLLVDGARLPLLVANGIAILCCSILNFCLGDNWAFAAKQKAVQNKVEEKRKNIDLSHFRSRNIKVKELLKNVVGKQLPARSQANRFAVGNEQPGLDQPRYDLERRSDHCHAEFPLDGGHFHASIQPQTQEPSLLMLLRGSEPGCFDRLGSCKIGL
jgi:putative flippase GtrA